MDEKRLSEIEKLANAATPGPWFWDTNRRIRSCGLKAPHDGGTMVMDFVRWGMHSAQPRFNDCSKMFGGILRTAVEYDENPEIENPNAAFIAAAREAVPALVAEVRRLRAQVGSSPVCRWAYEYDDEWWSTGCGEDVMFPDSTPQENKCHFCHICGKPIEFVEALGGTP